MDMMGISHTQNLCWINTTGQKRLNVCTPILEEYEWANLVLYTGIMGLIYKKLKGGSAVENGYEAWDLKTKAGQRSGRQVILWILEAWVWPRAVMSWKLATTCLDGGLAVSSLMETQARLFVNGNPSQSVHWWKPKPDCLLMETQARLDCSWVETRARLFIDGNPSQPVHWWKPMPDCSLMETQAIPEDENWKRERSGLKRGWGQDPVAADVVIRISPGWVCMQNPRRRLFIQNETA